MLGAGFLSSPFPFFSIPTVFAGIILPEMFHRTSIRENEQNTVIRMHLYMINIISGMLIPKYCCNQFDQYLFRNLLGCAVCLATI